MKVNLDGVLEAVHLEFGRAKAWTDPNVKVRQHYRREGGRNVPTGERRTLPPDPFSYFSTFPSDEANEEALRHCCEAIGQVMALNARFYGAISADQLVLSIDHGPPMDGEATVVVTATPKPETK